MKRNGKCKFLLFKFTLDLLEFERKWKEKWNWKKKEEEEDVGVSSAISQLGKSYI